MDGGVWQAIVHRVAKSELQLSKNACMHTMCLSILCFLNPFNVILGFRWLSG